VRKACDQQDVSYDMPNAICPKEGGVMMRYSALALQCACDAVNQDSDNDSAHARMAASVQRVRGQVAASKAFMEGFNGYPLKLVVLPEYWMTGFPMRESRTTWREKAALDVGGDLETAIASMAQDFGLYICSNHYETDTHFPDLFFQANTIYGPSGDCVLRYRRMISLYSPSPWDVWDAYLDVYGYDAIFPVADTDIGVLATVASEEILYPEIARMMALKGAEVLLHPTSEVASPLATPKHTAKKARAVENQAYVVSANSGAITGTPVPAASTDAMSTIIDPYGRPLAEAGSGETMVANAVIDITALRDSRQKTGMTHCLSRLPLGAFAPAYQTYENLPPNQAAGGQILEKSQVTANQADTLARLTREGRLKNGAET